jgi:hypothetical protein
VNKNQIYQTNLAKGRLFSRLDLKPTKNNISIDNDFHFTNRLLFFSHQDDLESDESLSIYF